jgi:hypothetical protein
MPAPSRTRLVFFYGLFMDAEILVAQGIAALSAERCLLSGFALRIGTRAALVSSAGRSVYGILMLRNTMERTGANIMGKRMFDAGERSWPEEARKPAGDRDIRVSGGADLIQQHLKMGAIDELEIALAPVLFGGGRRLFENLHEPVPQFRIDGVVSTPDATHLRYVRA